MAAAAQGPKANMRAAFNVNTIPYISPRINIRGNPITTAMRVLSVRSTHLGLEIAVDGRSLVRSDTENTHTFVSCGSPGPQKWDVKLIAAFDTLIPKSIKENFAAAFTKERVEICPTGWLASLASSSANPGGVAGLDARLLLDSGASIHVVGDANLLTGIQSFSFDKWVVCADGSRLPMVGTGTLQRDGFSIPKVCLVDGLKMNLISVSQLCKDHGLCCSFHGQKCEVIVADGTVVGEAILHDSGVYQLYSLKVPAEPEE